MENISFRVMAYSKSELAQLYFPFLADKRTAVRNLINLIHGNAELEKELAATGYRKTAKTLSPKQVGLIVHYLGEP